MNIKTTKLANSIGDIASFESLQKEVGTEAFEAEDLDEQSGKDALARLPLVSTLLNSPKINQNNFGVTINLLNTPEGLSAAQVLLNGLGQQTMNKPEPAPSPSSESSISESAVSFKPIAGGMALGLVGGVGLGMAIDALRSAGNASGNPVISSLAIGLGLAGTAFGGHLANGGSFRAKFFGVEISAEN